MKPLPVFLISLIQGMLFLSIGYGQGSWEKISIPTHQSLHALFFTDSLTGWVAGDSGVILHTRDGGVSWVQQQTNTLNEFTDVFFTDPDRGFASSINYAQPPYGTLLFKTTDGGNHWYSYPYHEDEIFISCIWYRDSLNGWMGGRPHALVKTTDGGMTWSQAAIDTSTLAFFPVMTVQFYNEKYGYASGGVFDIAGVIWRTWDGGEKWYAIDVNDAPADEVRGIHMFDSLHVMGAGGDPDFGYGVGMIRTWNGGVSWEYDELDIQGYVSDIDFRNDTEVWCPLGIREKLIFSLDGGNTWTETTPPGSAVIYQMTFTDPMHGYAVGRQGAFLRYIPPVMPSVREQTNAERDHAPVRFIPNPVHAGSPVLVCLPETTMKYSQQVTVIINDLMGNRLITNVFSGNQPDDQPISLDTAPLLPGVYPCRIISVSGPGIVSWSTKLMVLP